MTNDLISKSALIEALNKVTNLQRFTFLSPKEGGVRRYADKSGNWIERYEAVKILDDLINSAPVVNGEAVAIDVNKMVDRFLAWKLPSDFSPDCGITFEANRYHPHVYEPIGTNLFTAIQAKAMFEYCIHYQSDFNLEYTAKRIRRLLNALDIPDPSNGNDNTLMGCLFSLLGQACSKIESAKPQSARGLLEKAAKIVESHDSDTPMTAKECANKIRALIEHDAPSAPQQSSVSKDFKTIPLSTKFEDKDWKAISVGYGTLSDIRLNLNIYLNSELLATPSAPIEAQQSYADGLEKAARVIESKAESLCAEHGIYDGETGVWEFGNHNTEDAYNSYMEDADDIRALIPSTQAPKESEG